MGQKTNPNIFQLAKTSNWQSKYFEKKIVEHSIYSKKDIEIRNFTQKFFKNHGRVMHYCKICYLEKSLHIFVSYYLNLNSLPFTEDNIPKIYTLKQKKVISPLLDLNSKKFYSQIKQMISLKNKEKTFKKPFIKSFDNKKLEKYNAFNDSFLEKFSTSLINFTSKKFKLVIQLKALNTTLNTKLKINTNKFLKKKLINLRKYKQTEFFKTGINTLFICATNNKSSKLLAQFIAIQLKNIKRHNFFLKFVKNTLTLLSNNILSKFKGIKIKIKGRLNGRPRARSQTFKIANDVSVITIDSKIDYSEETAFTANGTLGIKVWIHELSN